MNWGFDSWQSRKLFPNGSKIAQAKVQLGDASSIDLIAPQTISLTVPKTSKPSYTLSVRYNGPIKAPFKKGQPIALLVAKFADGSEQVSPLVAANDVDVAGFFGRVANGFKGLVGL